MEFSVGRMPYDELVKKVRELIAKNLSGKDDDNGGGGIDESQIVTSLDETSNTKVLSAATGQLIKDAINAKLDRIRPNVQFVQMPQELSADYLDVVVGSKIYVPFYEFPQLVGSEVGDLKIVRVAVEDYPGGIFELAYTYYVYLFGNVTSVDDNGINVLVEWTYRETNEGVNPGINEDAVKQLINSAIEEATRFFITYDDIAGMLSNYAVIDNITIQNNTEDRASVTGIYTINSTIPGTPPLRFFVGTRAEFAAIADTNNVFAIITDDPNVDAYNALVEAVDVLEGLYANHEARIDNLEALYDDHEKRITTLNGIVAAHNAKLIDHDDTLETHEGQINTLNGIVADHKKRLDGHDTRITDIETNKIPLLNARCKSIEDDVSGLKGAVEELQNDVGVLQGKVKEVEEDIVSIEKNIAAVDADLEETKEIVTNNSNKISSIILGTTTVEKARCDAEGNVIDETYVRKDEIADTTTGIKRQNLTDNIRVVAWDAVTYKYQAQLKVTLEPQRIIGVTGTISATNPFTEIGGIISAPFACTINRYNSENRWYFGDMGVMPFYDGTVFYFSGVQMWIMSQSIFLQVTLRKDNETLYIEGNGAGVKFADLNIYYE